ncbi:MAG: VOC family protein [Actinomycetota bacterium]
MSGKVVHFEIPADDVARAEAFYRTVFGWQTNSMPGMGYTLITTTPVGENGVPAEPGAINGGMFKRIDAVPSPVVVMQVDDIDASLGLVESNGGTTVRPKQPVGDMGWAAYFKDPEGNVLCMWQSAPGGG